MLLLAVLSEAAGYCSFTRSASARRPITMSASEESDAVSAAFSSAMKQSPLLRPHQYGAPNVSAAFSTAIEESPLLRRYGATKAAKAQRPKSRKFIDNNADLAVEWHEMLASEAEANARLTPIQRAARDRVVRERIAAEAAEARARAAAMERLVDNVRAVAVFARWSMAEAIEQQAALASAVRERWPIRAGRRR